MFRRSKWEYAEQLLRGVSDVQDGEGQSIYNAMHSETPFLRRSLAIADGMKESGRACKND